MPGFHPGARPAPPTVVGLDILRLFAALLVVGYHWCWAALGHHAYTPPFADGAPWPSMWSAASWGWIGVELFFVISGFVITMSAVGKSAGSFAVGRATRLLPGLFVFATLALAVVLYARYLPVDQAVVAWARAVTLFPKGPWIDGVVWTLTVEVVFYGLILLVIATGRMDRLGRYMRIAAAAIALFWAVVAIHNFAIHLTGIGGFLTAVAADYKARVVLVTTGSYFLVGMFAYEAYRHGLSRERALWLCAMVLASAAGLWFKAALSIDGAYFGVYPVVAILLWFAGCALCALSLAGERRRPLSPLWRARARTIGMLTYPLYLVHNVSGGWLLDQLSDAGVNLWLARGTALGICLAVSYGFSVALEPAMRRGLHALLTPAPKRLAGAGQR